MATFLKRHVKTIWREVKMLSRDFSMETDEHSVFSRNEEFIIYLKLTLIILNFTGPKW